MFVALLLAAATSGPPSVALPGLQGVNVDAERLEFLNEHVAQVLRSSGLQVVTRKEISVMLGLERQRQLMGCTEDSESCNAELANALGSETVLSGAIAKLETGWFQVDLKILSARSSRPVSARSGRVPSEAALVESLGRAANEMARELFKALRPDVPPPASLEMDFGRAPYRRLSWIPAVLVVGGAVLAGVMFAQAGTVHWQLTQNPDTRFTDVETNEAVQRGRTAQTLGAVGIGVAAAALAASAFLFLWREQPMALTASLWAEGGSLGVSAAW